MQIQKNTQPVLFWAGFFMEEKKALQPTEPFSKNINIG
jgi:hypothetical protein